ncbi:retrotransposable element Tf2 protein type 1 [Trichonephila clavipes]|nr:retrotransposable element Tf2 protein type 1 [Trichonephila clavipes]
MNYYNANNEDNINVKNNKGFRSNEADLKRLFNPAMVVEDTVPKQTTNRPQCNGKNERVNQTLVAKLRCKVNSTTKTPWTKLLEQVTYEYNNSPHDVTGFPPAYLMFGTLPYDSPLPNQVKLNYPPIQQARQIAVNRTIKHHKINKQRLQTARVDMNCLTARQTLRWPVGSPYLYPIEYISDMMLLPGNADDLAQQMDRVWQKIPQKLFRVLYHSMPRPVAACIQARGGTTPY